jgi:hypothetical protein
MQQMIRKILAVSMTALIMTSAANAATVAYTSFEEPTTGGKYTDTLGAATSHALINNSSEAPVNYAGGAELGFSSYYTYTGSVDGLADGDFVGVTNYTGTVGSYPDGVQGFQMSDTDGIMTTTIQTVDLSGYTGGSVSVDLFIQETGYESADRARVWLTVDGGAEIDLLNTAGSDIDDLGIEGYWFSLSEDLSAYTTATLAFELETNAATEAMYVDNVLFTGNAAVVPVPAAAWLFGSAALGLVGFRRGRKDA